jgi:hypothetical protein
MNQSYYDPVGDMWKRWGQRLHRIALMLMDENAIMGLGQSMTIPNDIKPLRICFERLESEPDPRVLAQRSRRSREQSEIKLRDSAARLFIYLLASRSIR